MEKICYGIPIKRSYQFPRSTFIITDIVYFSLYCSTAVNSNPDNLTYLNNI